MEKFKGTKGKLELKYAGDICIGIGTVGAYSQITANSILPNTDEDYEKEKEEIEANMKLYAAAPELLEASMQVIKGFEGGITDELYNYTRLIELQKVINKALGLTP